MKRWTIGLLLGLAIPSAGPSQVPPARPGVTTHFSQGWPARLMDSAAALGTGTIRDSLHWNAIESVAGQYSFTDRNSGHVARACAAGMKVLLGIDPRNKNYDDGKTAYSPAARAAFANYLLAIADRYRGCVVAIEVGNEINAKNLVTGPAATDRAASHTALLRTIHERIKPSHPALKIIGGSTNTIATGFLGKLFDAGALNYMDAVAVHPYRNDPEVADWELGRLKAAMVKAGRIRPIWATEFSRDFAAPADAAPFYLKMTSLVQGAGVSDHFWYALIDQKWFPTMGLLTLAGEPKPASRAYAFAAANLAPLGPAQRIDHGDPTLFHFRYGANAHVIWGGRRTLTVTGTPRFHHADGSLAARPPVVSDMPIVIFDAGDVTFGPPQVLADSLYGFAQAPLGWYARRATGLTVALSPVDWDWTTYLGNPTMPQMVVNIAGIGPAYKTSAVVRYPADRSARVVASICLSPLGTTGDGTTASLVHNGTTLWTQQVGPLTGRRTGQASVSVAAGDTVEFILAPNATPAGDRMKYRFRISSSAADAAEC